MNVIHGLWPGVVSSYNPSSRTCRVEIPGVTDGSDVRPEAVFMNPLGDNAASTEIRIQPGDPVWLMFEGGDPRFPIITGYRTPRSGNPVGWRRWHHANIQLTADSEFLITVGATTIKVTEGLVKVEGADMDVSGGLKVGKSLLVLQNISANGNITDLAGSPSAKNMAQMRQTYNTHGGHYYNTNRVPDNQM